MIGEQPTIIVISVQNTKGDPPHVQVRYPDMTSLNVDQEQDWVGHELGGEQHKITFLSTLHKAGYRVYHMDKIDKWETLWYWRLKDE